MILIFFRSQGTGAFPSLHRVQYKTANIIKRLQVYDKANPCSHTETFIF